MKIMKFHENLKKNHRRKTAPLYFCQLVIQYKAKPKGGVREGAKSLKLGANQRANQKANQRANRDVSATFAVSPSLHQHSSRLGKEERCQLPARGIWGSSHVLT